MISILAAFALGGLLGFAAGLLAGRSTSASAQQAESAEREEAMRALSHDLRGPLTVIRGEVELVLSQDDTEPEQRQRSSETVTQEVEKIESLVRQR